jgi:antitoxin component YwqK of YwqJK toxin-antitoxin module
MKIIVAIAFVWAFIACQSPQITIPNVWVKVEADSSLRFENGLVLQQNKPFSGYIVSYYSSQKLRLKEAYLSGRAENVHQKWHENGQLQEQRGYLNNHKHGIHRGWWPNGKLKFEYNFADDVATGVHQEWYDNGQLFTRLTYDKQGQPEGSQQMWYNTGQIKANYLVKNGRRFGLLGAKGCMGENEKERTGLLKQANL